MARALIIKKQWLDRIFDNGKTWEMRSYPTGIRGRICLIESGTGLIVGEAVLEGCEKPTYKDIFKHNKKHQIEDIRLFKRWPFAWILKDAKRYDKPKPYDHPQGAVIWVKIKGIE
jgi:hypothetical protein